MMLTPESFSKARDFLLTRARPLERALYRFHFGGVPAAEARAALAAFQNNNGGFGRALEPDLRLPASSALATSVAFQHLRQLGLPAEDPMVRAAVRWTQTAFDRELDRWPAVPPAVNDWPHAPWWTWKGPGERGFTTNPGVELVAHLWHYRAVADAGFLAEITARVEKLVEALPEEPEMHDLLCLLHLAETPFVPATLREGAMEYVRWAGPVIVARDPQAWAGYGLQPLMLAPRVDSLMEPLLSDTLSANLDFVIGRQDAEGAWPPNWNWFGIFPEDWPQAELEWKGVLTLQTLLTLHSYGRLPLAPISTSSTPA
ncbi:MAG: hypothetical protein ABSG50_05795 [Opitutaceae bacterium]|jgi:hypothetical protein